MFSFLNIGILVGLISVSIPFLIHLFAKKKQKKIHFSTLRFLKILQPQKLRRIQLKQILLMLIRSLIILFLILGFSRPVCKKSASINRSNASSVMSLIIDRSLSLKRNGMREELKRNLHSAVDMMKPNDRASFVLTRGSKQAPNLVLYNQQSLKKMVDDIDISFFKGDVIDKVFESMEFLDKQRELNKEIFIFTDMQSSEWEAEKDSSLFNSWEGNIFIIPIQGEDKNIAVTQNRIKSGIFHSEAVIDFFADIENYSNNIDDVLVRISLDDKTIDQTTINLTDNEKKRVTFNSIQVNKGWHHGTISVQDGSFPYDDVSYFTYHLPSKNKVFLIGNELDDVLPVQLCLEAQDKDNNRYEIENFVMGSAWSEKLDSSDVVVFSNYPYFTASEVEEIEQFLQKGGGIFFFMGNRIDIKRLNQQFFQPVAEITLGNVTKSKEPSKSSLRIRNVDYGHPLFQHIFEKGKENFKSPHIFKSIEIISENFMSIIELSNGFPFMAEKDVLKGKIICISTALQQSWSNFVASTIFAPLMIRSIDYLASDEKVKSDYNTVGDNIKLFINPESLQGEFYVQDPNGRRTVVRPEIENKKIFLESGSTSKLGIYSFFHNTNRLGIKAVNVDNRESDFSVIDQNEIREFFPDADVHFITNINALDQVVSKSRFGKELWREMILLALVLLVIEMFLARSKKSRNPD